jgi:hypothetical protein
MMPCAFSSTTDAVTLILTEVSMKRAAYFGMLAAAIASAGTFLAAQSGPLGKREVSPSATVTVQASPPAHVSVLNPMTPLQQRFMELSAKKAQLMTEEQLQQEAKLLDQQVEGLTAWTKLEEAARLLREVQEKHPQTKAAEVANSALGIIERNRPPISPYPDPMGRIDGKREQKSPVETGTPFERHERSFDRQ